MVDPFKKLTSIQQIEEYIKIFVENDLLWVLTFFPSLQPAPLSWLATTLLDLTLN